MIVALTLATRRDSLVEDRAGAVDLPRFRQALGLFFEEFGRILVVGAQLCFRERQSLIEELQCPVVLAGVGIADGEVMHAPERIRVVGPELRLPQRQRLLVEL